MVKIKSSNIYIFHLVFELKKIFPLSIVFSEEKMKKYIKNKENT